MTAIAFHRNAADKGEPPALDDIVADGVELWSQGRQIKIAGTNIEDRLDTAFKIGNRRIQLGNIPVIQRMNPTLVGV